MELIFPLSVRAVGSQFLAERTLMTPSNPWLAGKTVYSQALFVDPSNPLGIVFSNGVVIGLGGEPTITQVLASPDSSASTGSLQATSHDQGGPVVRFVGPIF